MPYPLSRPSFARAPALAPLQRPGAHARAAELIARYPHLSRGQIDNLVGIMPQLSALDLSLMIADDKLAPRLEAFISTHRELMAPSWSDYAVIAAILFLPIAILFAVLANGGLS